jgi:hypothetical protein
MIINLRKKKIQREVYPLKFSKRRCCMKNQISFFKYLLTVVSIVLLSSSFYSIAKSKSAGITVTKEGEIGIVRDDGYGGARYIALGCIEGEDWVYYYIKPQGRGMELMDKDGAYIQIKGVLTVDKEDRNWLLVQTWEYVDRPEDDNIFEVEEIIDQEGVEFENTEADEVISTEE